MPNLRKQISNGKMWETVTALLGAKCGKQFVSLSFQSDPQAGYPRPSPGFQVALQRKLHFAAPSQPVLGPQSCHLFVFYQRNLFPKMMDKAREQNKTEKGYGILKSRKTSWRNAAI